MPVTIGLLLDSHRVPAWQKSILQSIVGQPNLKLVLVILNQSNFRSGSGGRWAYRLLRKLDRNLFKSKLNLFQSFDVSELLQEVDSRLAITKQTKHKDEFLPEDINWIKDHQPDILIRFGFRILKGEILKVAKYGTWSLHHGDSAVNRDWPPAFWEVVNKEPITGVTLQILSEKLDAGTVLGKSFCKTDLTSFNRNQTSIYAAGVELFCRKLSDIATLGADVFFSSLKKDSETYSPVLYRDPVGLTAWLIFLKFWWRRFLEMVTRSLLEEQWALYYHQDTGQPFTFKSPTPISPPANTDWADPFLFQYHDRYYVFFENLNKKSGFGKIDCLALDQPHSKPVRVLDEPHHLSYPTIVEWEGSLFMLAEAAQSKAVWLYQCVKFPDQWRKVNALLSGLEMYDPTLLHHEGLWYLFGTQKPVAGTSPDQFLHIYYCDDLLNGTWHAHPLNPVTHDVRGTRSAGKIFNYQGRLIRPAQLGTPKYGYGIRLQQIITLSPTEYEETPFQDMLPWSNDILATHTYSFSGSWFMTDGQRRRFKYF